MVSLERGGTQGFNGKQVVRMGKIGQRWLFTCSTFLSDGHWARVYQK